MRVNTGDLIEVFKDTQAWYNTDSKLKESIEKSIAGTKVYQKGELPSLGVPQLLEQIEVTISRHRTLETALYLLRKNPDSRVAVLNFASATNPGGGVTRGSRAQEEALCRCSTLYPVLCNSELRPLFYNYHRNLHDPLYTDACIYTPGITVIKSDTDLPQRMAPQNWRQVDVITCAAPNLRANPYNSMNPGSGPAANVSMNELLNIHKERGRKIIRIAIDNHVDIMVLGAFGCGVFQNPPEVVAEAYRSTIDEFQGYLKHVEFAVYCTPRDDGNFRAFEKVFSR